MPLYTFYPTQANGLAQTFEILDLQGDEEARFETLHVFDRHSSAASVVVYRDQRKLYARSKSEETLRDDVSEAQAL